MTTANTSIEPTYVGFRTAWTAAPANYDIVANDPFKLNMPGLANPSEGRPCRRIVCGGAAGTLVVTGLDGVNVTLQALAGSSFDIQALALVSTSTATNVMVFW